MYPIKLRPIAMERVWGGSKLKSQFGVESSANIGEYWVVSGYPDAQSEVTNGRFAGRTLSQLIADYPEAYLGDAPQPRFPLLIKFLEAREHLSVQVHPTTQQLQGAEYGKTEAWYVLECEADAKVVHGHKFANQDEFLSAAKRGEIQAQLHHQAIEPGSFVFVPPNTLHALLAGTTVVEISETSDVTYRVYDWDRLLEEDSPRKLHIERAAEVLEYGEPQTEASPLRTMIHQRLGVTHERLISSDVFAVDKMDIRHYEYRVETGHLGNPDTIVVVEGAGELVAEGCASLSLRAGEAVIVPGTMPAYTLSSDEHMVLLRIYY